MIFVGGSAPRLRATTVALYAYFNPVVALIIGALILHKSLTWTRLTAAGIILAGAALAQSRGRTRRAAEDC